MIIPSLIPGKFNCNGKIIDFSLLIEYYSLDGKFVLAHWNKLVRLWGYYDGFSHGYFLVEANIVISSTLLHYPISIPDSGTLPTDVILYPNAVVSRLNGELLINIGDDKSNKKSNQ